MAGVFRFTANGDFNSADSATLQFVSGSMPVNPAPTTSFKLSFDDFGILGYQETGSTTTFFLKPEGGSNIAPYSGGAYFSFSDGTAAVEFDGGSWGDTLIGGSVGDVLDGRAGDDTLDGGDGSDRLQGGIGNDTMKGGRGDDMFNDLTGSNFIDGGEDIDTLSFAGGGAVTVDMAQGYSLQLQNDRYTINTFTSIENLLGSAVADKMTGDARANDISGDDGNDVLAGAAGADAIRGGSGRDSIDGGDGNDTLYGGNGGDTLTGGTGLDRFVYDTLVASRAVARGRDTILDFSRAEHDRIDLSGIDAVPGGGDDKFRFVTAFSGAAGELRVTAHGTGEWLVSADIDGDKTPDFQIFVYAPTILNATDFVL